MSKLTLPDLLAEYAHSQAYSVSLINDLSPDQVHWRPDEQSSSMAWHLGHQGAVNHYLVRNLTSAEVTFNAGFDKVFDSATPEPDRGELPPVGAIIDYREAIAESTLRIISRIATYRLPHRRSVRKPPQGLRGYSANRSGKCRGYPVWSTSSRNGADASQSR